MSNEKTRNDKQKRKSLLTGASILAAAAMFAGQPAVAQDTGDEGAEEADETIVVVGSRLRRDVYNSPSPIQVVTNEESIRAGFNATAEVLQGTAISGGNAQINNAFGGYVTNGGPGANTLSLRGLGATRTLVLLNGRRVAPAGSRGSVGSADLNVLPSALIDRIEVLRDGASSIYGSDAVSGVVNIITRQNVDGLTLSYQLNAPLDANGAGESNRFSAVAGANGDRWHIGGSVEYYTREELTYGDRSFMNCPVAGWSDGSDYIDPYTGQPKCWGLDGGGVTINTIGTSARAGVPALGNPTLAGYNRWRPNSAVTTGLVGFEGVSGGSTDVRDTFDPRMLNQSLISPVDITNVFVEASYELTPNVELYTEVLHNHRESSQVGYRQLTLDYPVGSPLLPPQLAAGGAFAANQGLNPGSNVQTRAFIGFGNYTSAQEVDFTKFLGGARGDLFANWRYDVYASHTVSDAEYMFEQFLLDRLQASINNVVDNGDGTFSCAPTAPAGCVAAPVLNSHTIGGNLPADFVNWMFRPVVGNTEYTETVFSAGVDGPLFRLPAGEVMAFFGAEYREMEIDDTPGPDMVSGNLWGFSTAGITRGTDSVQEVFGEIEFPILADLPFAQALTFNASARYTDYDSYGDDTTYKVGLLYTPTDWLSFRGTYGTSYRAPALYEMYLSPTSGFVASGNDPCNEWDSEINPNLVTNCGTGEGLPPGFTATTSVRVLQQGGITSGLEAETSDNLTVGFVLQPELPAGIGGDLSFSVDYYEIEVNNGVSRVGYSYILSQCYESAPSDFNADNGYCALVERDGATNQLTVNDSYVNIATDILKGFDYNIRYSRDIGPTQAVFNLYLTQYTNRTSTLFPDDPVRNTVGIVNRPEFAGTFDASVYWDDWNFRYGVDWTSSTDYDEYYLKYFGYDLTSLGYQPNTDDYFLHHASLQYRADDWAITAGVRNLFNEDPPTISAGITNRVGNAPLYSGYDYIGRTAFINLTRSF